MMMIDGDGDSNINILHIKKLNVNDFTVESCLVLHCQLDKLRWFTVNGSELQTLPSAC